MNLGLNNTTFAKIAILVAVIPFLWLGTLGLLRHSGEMKSDGATSGCLFDGQAEVCSMNISEHIAIWQTMLTSLPQNAGPLEMLAIVVALVSILVLWGKQLFEFTEHVIKRFLLYAKQHSQINLFNSLEEAFSQGILNPKLYKSVN